MTSDEPAGSGMLAQNLFLRMLCLERKRAERSGRRFVLMLLESGRLLKTDNKEAALEKVLCALSESTRDTDMKGWYKEGSVIGVLFTEIGSAEGQAVANALLTKVTKALSGTLSIEEINQISLSFHVYPEDSASIGPGGPSNSVLYLDQAREMRQKKGTLFVKRLLDIVGSIMLLIICLPVLIAIAIAIKLTSKGPILFRQVRVGQYGKKFTFLKFRSMYYKNDPTIHEQYVKRLILGTATQQTVAGQPKLYKLTADPRITQVGRFLRKTSLDELPQFLHVLKGEMSLVGPRPPVTYEYESYDLWHKRRLLGAKPGITGLWQVHGRSRVKFDEMVRIDLRYAKACSLWLDVKILLQTPGAIFSGDGAC
jgi:lipopolysaccharide/colanic/teichoic acid biosynthesis glycosyltransferase